MYYIKRNNFLWIPILLTGCFNFHPDQYKDSAVNAGNQGDYVKQAGIIEHRAGGLIQASPLELRALCEAYKSSADFSKINACLEEMENRKNRGDDQYFEGLTKHSFSADIKVMQKFLDRQLGKKNAYMDEKYVNFDNDLKLGEIMPIPSSLGQYTFNSYNPVAFDVEGISDPKKFIISFNDFRKISNQACEKEKAEQNNEWQAKHSTLADCLWRHASVNNLVRAQVWFKAKKYQNVIDEINYYHQSHDKFAQVSKQRIYTSDKGAGVFESATRLLVAPIVEQNVNYIWTLPDLDKLNMYYVLAMSRLELGEYALAEKEFDKFFDIPQSSSNGSLYWLALFAKGRALSGLGEYSEAIPWYKKSIKEGERVRHHLLNESNKIAFSSSRTKLYSTIIHDLMLLKEFEVAFDYVEQAKARALIDLLASKEKTSGASALAQANNMAQQLDVLKNNVIEIAANSPKHTRNIQALESKLEKVLNETPEVASLISVQTSTLSEIQSMLGVGEALVEYFYFNNDLYIYLIKPAYMTSYKVSAKGLKQEVKKFRAAIELEGNEWIKPSESLYLRLIAPLRAAINDVENLIIVPHGVMHYIPFNALQAPDGNPLIKHFTLRTLPSASVLAYSKIGEVESKGLLAFGNPDLKNKDYDLPGALQEVKSIGELWGNSKIITRKNATETLLKNISSAYRFIHLATHGEFMTKTPMNSRMLLASDSANDGNLTVSEIYELQLNAELVVLSACQTSLGDVTDGDDVIGLTRGFLYAGARSVIGSLWAVPDDSTQFLMVQLYKNYKLMNGREALQKAQIATREKYKHPYYWAAFQMTGGR